MVRKTLASLTATGLVTYRDKVLHPLDGVTFFSGNKEKPAQYQYPNRSVLVMGGLDKASKVMSSEYDMIYVQEAIELSENDWESLTTRLRNGIMPFQQLLADTNPDAPTHWLKRRVDSGATRLIESRHEDNPRLYVPGAPGTWTEEGVRYRAVLDRLTGVRKSRLRDGLWVAAEGVIYEGYDPAIHLIDRFDIPADWRRFRSVDFGYTNPFVCQWWAIDPDGRLYLYRELYHTGRLVSDHAATIARLSAGERIEYTVADHDAEDRATLHAGGIPTIPARKEVGLGIQAVSEQLAVAGDGRPRLFLLRDSLVERDASLVEAGKPTCTAEEIPGYVWVRALDNRPIKEEPLKLDDHGADALRYAVVSVARLPEPGALAIDNEDRRDFVHRSDFAF